MAYRRPLFYPWAAYEKAKAKERQEATQAKPGEGKVGGGNVSTTETIKSRDAIGARVGVRKGEGERTEISHSKQ